MKVVIIFLLNFHNIIKNMVALFILSSDIFKFLFELGYIFSFNHNFYSSYIYPISSLYIIFINEQFKHYSL